MTGWGRCSFAGTVMPDVSKRAAGELALQFRRQAGWRGGGSVGAMRVLTASHREAG
jgi:hypothetical protein